jgi:hypothetical protein
MELYGRNNQFTMPWATHTKILLKKVLAVHLVNKFSIFIEAGGSLPCSEDPTTGPYPEPDESNLHHHSHFF